VCSSDLAIDSSSTYAGVTRGSAAWFDSKETAVGGLLAVTDMMDMYESIRDNDCGGVPGKILCPWNQYTNYYNLSGVPGMKIFSPTDSAPGYEAQSFNGKPIAPIADMTDTIMLFIDERPGKWVRPRIRDWQVNDQGRSGDSDVYAVNYADALVCREPKFQGKLTGITA
jgi:hypothetical protein